MTGVRSIEAVAAGLTAAFAVGDLDQLAPLLAPDVRWGGDEDTEQTCHTRGQVLAWYQGLRLQGVRVQVLETQIRGDAVVLRMAVQWPRGWDGADLHRSTQEQVFRVRDGLVVDIRADDGVGARQACRKDLVGRHLAVTDPARTARSAEVDREERRQAASVRAGLWRSCIRR